MSKKFPPGMVSTPEGRTSNAEAKWVGPRDGDLKPGLRDGAGDPGRPQCGQPERVRTVSPELGAADVCTGRWVGVKVCSS